MPPLIAQRLDIWGRCIRAQRVSQHISAADLCTRLGISDAMLRRMEQGDPRPGAATYLTALWILGVLDTAVPPLDPLYWSQTRRPEHAALDLKTKMTTSKPLFVYL